MLIFFVLKGKIQSALNLGFDIKYVKRLSKPRTSCGRQGRWAPWRSCQSTTQTFEEHCLWCPFLDPVQILVEKSNPNLSANLLFSWLALFPVNSNSSTWPEAFDFKSYLQQQILSPCLHPLQGRRILQGKPTDLPEPMVARWSLGQGAEAPFLENVFYRKVWSLQTPAPRYRPMLGAKREGIKNLRIKP